MSRSGAPAVPRRPALAATAQPDLGRWFALKTALVFLPHPQFPLDFHMRLDTSTVPGAGCQPRGMGQGEGCVSARGARHVGIVIKHRAGCASEREEERCNCRRVYQAAVWSARDHRPIRTHFDSLAGAKSWRAESYGKLRRRELRAPSAMTFGEAAALWLLGVRTGSIRTRSGDRYKPSTIRSYELALRGPEHGKGCL